MYSAYLLYRFMLRMGMSVRRTGLAILFACNKPGGVDANGMDFLAFSFRRAMQISLPQILRIWKSRVSFPDNISVTLQDPSELQVAFCLQLGHFSCVLKFKFWNKYYKSYFIEHSAHV
jgi:hypothetical protein